MEYLQKKLLALKTKQGKRRILSPERERDRLLQQYAGIFPTNIEEFAKTLAKKKRKIRNYSR